jgi:pimeloyl-ACP methyl ester carboxylesterase
MKQPITLTSVLVLLVSLFLSCANTPKITDASGEEIPGSIASMERITINGIEQWIVLRGHHTDAPVLLWLAGGPGGSEVGWTRRYLGELEKELVFVNWEQPGSGKSARWTDIKELRVEEFVEQTILLSEYLADRFAKERIILLGHSWGSIIGLKAAQARPDLYHAYVGVGQQVNAVENDRIGYELVLREAEARGDDRLLRKLRDQGPPPYSVQDRGAYLTLFQKLSVFSPEHPGSSEPDFWAFIHPDEYTLPDSVRLIRSVVDGVNYVYPQLNGLDFESEVPSLELPLVLIHGRYDYTCVQNIAHRYFLAVDAPLKEFHWLERGGHNACYQQPERFMEILRRRVLPLTKR